jgi:integrase
MLPIFTHEVLGVFGFMPNITKRVVDSAEPQQNKNGYFIWDDELKGFGVRVMPSGRKTYWAQYRIGGRSHRVSCGVHGHVTAEQARQKAKDIFGRVARGVDPAEVIATHRQTPTVAEVCDRFIEQHVDVRLKPTTQYEYKRNIRLFIKPAFGNHKIVDIKRADIADLHHKFHHKPYQANRTLGVLSKLFNLAEVWGLRPDGSNPCRHVPKYPESEREHFLTREQVGNLWAVLDARLNRGAESIYVTCAFKLLLLTGCRLSEIQKLRWEEVKEPHIDLQDSKTGRRIVPLNDMARDILNAIPRLPDNPYVICGHMPGKHITDLQHPWRRIRKEAGLGDTRIHDLRHTFASHAAQNGVELVELMKLTGHTQVRTALRYMHFANARIRQTSNAVAASLTSCVKSQSTRIGTRPMLQVVK